MCFDLPDLMQLFPLRFRYGAHFLLLSRETWSSRGGRRHYLLWVSEITFA